MVKQLLMNKVDAWFKLVQRNQINDVDDVHQENAHAHGLMAHADANVYASPLVCSIVHACVDDVRHEHARGCDSAPRVHARARGVR